MGLLQSIGRKVFGTQNDREIKRLDPLIQKIQSFEPELEKLSDTDLKAKTPAFRERLANGETLDDILPEAFATVREASRRVLGMRHYDVQMIGGITLHRGRIAEMKTGEGKTLVATLPCYLNGLTGKGVHVVTVNDYLAKRDSEWMGSVHRFLGLSVGNIVHGLNDAQRRENYACDITYGTNNEFGFDYLRDNMKFRLEHYVQRELNYAIVDEVDSILIDEARTPLIISGPTEDSTDLYYEIDRHIRQTNLQVDVDYTIDEKSKSATLNEAGVDKMEKRLGIENLYDPRNIELLHHVNQALRAHVLFKIDVDYVVRDNEVMIVDEFTGRLMPGRRWSDGLHQAIEAKEGAKIENENQTLASITFQNYFRMYNKLSGMTGTADTEATEFKQIYNLDVTIIPTNKPIARIDDADVIYKSMAAKNNAILEHIRELSAKGQPTLVGTVSVEKSEELSVLMKNAGIKHSVLNAKQHQKEATVVAQAGRSGSITIATNMAGRGTDIVLGGNAEELAESEVGPLKKGATDKEKAEHEQRLQDALAKWEKSCSEDQKRVLEAGGLYIIGTERHESRRIDNQLRGRAGRQGDPGASRFYLSLDDDLMRIFGGARIQKFMEDDMPIEHRWINRAIENAQKKVEGHNYDIRKHLLQYDDVMNQQRKVVYRWRKEVLKRDNVKDMIMSMIEELADKIAFDFFPNGKLPKVEGRRHLDLEGLNDVVKVNFNVDARIKESDIEPFSDKGVRALVIQIAENVYTQKESDINPEILRKIEQQILLETIDTLWKDHLLEMDRMREGIGLRGYGQKDPLVEYKKEGFRLFEMMMIQITEDVIRKIYSVQLSPEYAQALQNGMDLFDHDEDESDLEYNLNSDGDLVGSQNFAPVPSPNHPAGGPLPPGGEIGAGGPYADPGNFFPSTDPSQNFQPVVSGEEKVGRNDPCPCGSGKKYKKCHGK